MAFNLNKNEEASSSSKFDLSKSNPPVITGAEQEKRKSKAWPFVIAGLLVAALAAWYFTSTPGSHTNNTTATTDTVAATQAKNTTPPVTTGKAGNDNNSVATVSVTSLNNRSPATFAKGSNAISNLDRSLIKDIMAFLKKNPGSAINVNGYASSEGELAVNQQISQSRADAFKNYLVSKGIAAGRINASGKGIDNPISSNDTEEGRIKNRRVEIVFQ